MMRFISATGRMKLSVIIPVIAIWAIFGLILKATHPVALEALQRTELCTMQNVQYLERWLQAFERSIAGNESGTDALILVGYCPYYGSWPAPHLR